ncbi:hypothetical protein PGSY75_1114600 [Plasmodium gaboni]|uniref:Uncharacterized protein n=1 Tax=Plasmodium gaboni TaxID=647221 RepID=A0A151LIL9_9APIC|nr:hypothetical protein PGSY75_1114600 [Plasmodium gaboni]KYN98784.1 hypothetical protein PGSY75_1114600 [Plasmodium gaboni]SOV15468.1 conserved Plasmodium protein, unknown function [Plasmodium gaboni]
MNKLNFEKKKKNGNTSECEKSQDSDDEIMVVNRKIKSKIYLTPDKKKKNEVKNNHQVKKMYTNIFQSNDNINNKGTNLRSIKNMSSFHAHNKDNKLNKNVTSIIMDQKDKNDMNKSSKKKHSNKTTFENIMKKEINKLEYDNKKVDICEQNVEKKENELNNNKIYISDDIKKEVVKNNHNNNYSGDHNIINEIKNKNIKNNINDYNTSYGEIINEENVKCGQNNSTKYVNEQNHNNFYYNSEKNKDDSYTLNDNISTNEDNSYINIQSSSLIKFDDFALEEINKELEKIIEEENDIQEKLIYLTDKELDITIKLKNIKHKKNIQEIENKKKEYQDEYPT